MRITIRSAERMAVVEILEADFPTANKLADEVIKRVVDELSRREAYGVKLWVSDPAMSFAFGPYWNVAQARTAALQSGANASVHKLGSPADLEILSDPESHAIPSHCKTCSHPLFAHGFPRKKECVVPKCKCKGHN